MCSRFTFRSLTRVLSLGLLGSFGVAFAEGPTAQGTSAAAAPATEIVKPPTKAKANDAPFVPQDIYAYKMAMLNGGGTRGANDLCAGAIGVAIPSMTVGSTVNATIDTAPFCGTSIDSPGVWYTVVGNGRTITATTCNDITGYDTKLNIYCGTCDNLICIGGNDDGGDESCDCPNCGGANYESRVLWCSAQGTTYHVLVQGFGGATGAFRLDIFDNGVTCPNPASCQPPPPVDNDDCQTARLVLCPSVSSGTNLGATTDTLQPSCSFAGAPTNSDVWYKFVATAASVLVDTCGAGTMTDSIISVYDACGGNEIGCNDDSCGLLSSTLVNGLTVNQTYFVRVAGWNATAQGTFTLTLSCLAPCVTQQAGDIPENEPQGGCADNYIDTFNAGCNSDPPSFSAIQCGQTVFGASGTFLNGGAQYRDTDWWLLTVPPQGQILTWSVIADFPLLIGFVAQPCPQPGFLQFATGNPCQAVSITSALLPAGNYACFVAPSTFAGVGCGVHYRGTLTCETPAANGACCVGTNCSIVTHAACTSLGGTYQGDNTNCGSVTYGAIQTCTEALEEISTTGTLAPASSNCDDCSDLNIPIGFSFPFYTTSYSTVAICSNGFLTFDQTGASPFTNTALPSPAPPNNMVCPMWDDFRTDAIGNGDVYYKTATSPSRFIVEWKQVRRFAAATGENTFEAILYQDGHIAFRYGALEGAAILTSTVGIENGDGTQAVTIPGADANEVEGGNTCRNIPGQLSGGACSNPCPCPGDFNGDHVVGLADLTRFLSSFGGPPSNPCMDFDHNGVVSLVDLTNFLSHFGTTCP